MKRIMPIMLLSFLIMSTGVYNAQAAETGMYVGGNYVQREFSTIGNFDMVPILDIAGELGYSCTYDGNQFWLYNDAVSFVFTMGSPDVYSNDGTWFGLDIVPQVINGRVMIPANFIIYNLGVSYTWDDLTKTLFIASDDTYRWLISTPEYQEGKAIQDTWNAVQGWWLDYNDDAFMEHFSENICFYPDGTFYLRTWREKGYGTYIVTAPNTIEADYISYYNFAGSTDYVEDGAYTSVFHLSNNTLNGSFNRVDRYCYSDFVGGAAGAQ